jgi:nitric oxide reductase subunit B
MPAKREMLISKTWIQVVVIVGLFGFLILRILAYRTYTDEPPIPSRVLGSNGGSGANGAMFGARS